MKQTALLSLSAKLVLAVMLLSLTACADKGAVPAPASVAPSNATSISSSSALSTLPANGKLYLYGEQHAVDKIVDKEFELWNGYYHDENMRHLFMEMPYYTAEFLNVWMQAENDDVLDAVYANWEGTAMYSPKVKEFFKAIKRDCPETVFTGTDVGHQYNTTGARFLQFLQEAGQQDSDQYRLAQENIEQGKYYVEKNDNIFRENAMAQNLMQAFDALGGESVMGIYGSAHTDPDAMEYTTGTIPCMAKQLKDKYGDALYTEDLSWMAKDIEPERIDSITVNGKAYEAAYFGKMDVSAFLEQYAYREIWRLENAYEDFKDAPTKNNVLPHDNYPMLIGENQVFVIDYIAKDGTVKREYHRTTQTLWNGKPITQEMIVDGA